MGEKVEKYKLTPEQVGFSKQFKKMQNIRRALAQGIQYKASELQQLQTLAQGMDQGIAQMLQQAPTDLDKTTEQPDPSQLVINY